MRILVDTALWYCHVRDLALPREVKATLDDQDHTVFLSPISIWEIIQKWRSGKLPINDPEEWLDQALEGYEILDLTAAIARKGALWEWSHKDPADRLIAATSHIHRIELWHSDTVLKNLSGFPQRYFKAPPL